MVSIATHPEHVSGALLPFIPEAMVYAVNKADDLLPLLSRATVCVIGPGLGDNDWSRALFATTIKSSLPMVVDASALGLLAQQPQKKDNWILTPHPGEASHLLVTTSAKIQENRVLAVTNIQQQYGGVTVLKGSETLVQTADRHTFSCPRGNPGMSSAGMGDVLTGVIAALIAQGFPLAEAAKLGVWIHATAGDHIVKTQGECGLLAHDLIPLFPLIINGFIS
jgi:hydroxyethylthiazole kinase-like uncharacterized protein yjeF